MAQVLKDSVVGYPESLAIFDKPIQNIGIRQVRNVNYYPVNDFTSQGVIQFSIPGTGNNYLDLSRTYLNIRCKILKKDNSRLTSWHEKTEEHAADEVLDDLGLKPRESRATADKGDDAEASGDAAAEAPGPAPGSAPGAKEDPGMVGVVNNTLHSMFSRVDVTLQNKLLTESDTSYPYQAYFKALLYTTKDAKTGPMQMQLYYHDDVDMMADTSWTLSSNKGFAARSRYFDGSQEVELSGGLYCDVFEINKLIPNGVGVNVTLYPAIPEFCLTSPDDIGYKLVITRATLSVCKTEVSPEIIAAHSELLAAEPATYCFTKSEIKKITLPSGMYNAEINDPFTGRVPSELVIGLVPSQSVHGNLRKNPFHFTHHKVSRIQVTADGCDMGESPVETSYNRNAADSLYVEAYKTLMGVNGNEDETPISRLDYPNGYCFYRFVNDHSSGEGSDEFLPLRRMGNLRISIRFDEMLEDTTTVILFARFPAGIKIDKNRAVQDL